jgi:hypothetical protein
MTDEKDDRVYQIVVRTYNIYHLSVVLLNTVVPGLGSTQQTSAYYYTSINQNLNVCNNNSNTMYPGEQVSFPVFNFFQKCNST